MYYMPMNIEINALTIRAMYRYYYYLRKALLLLCSVSLLSFLLSYLTGLSFLHYFSTFQLVGFLNQTIDRKYMFMVCNGILIFLAGKYSSSSSAPEPGDIIDVDEELMLQQSATPVDSLYEEAPVNYLKNNGSEEDASEYPVLSDADNHVGDSVEEPYEIEIENEKANEPTIGEKGTHTLISVGADDGECENNTEELNKKIEEFIRKMKQELQLEAQAQAQAQQQCLIPAA